MTKRAERLEIAIITDGERILLLPIDPLPAPEEKDRWEQEARALIAEIGIKADSAVVGAWLAIHDVADGETPFRTKVTASHEWSQIIEGCLHQRGVLLHPSDQGQPVMVAARTLMAITEAGWTDHSTTSGWKVMEATCSCGCGGKVYEQLCVLSCRNYLKPWLPGHYAKFHEGMQRLGIYQPL